ncbi:beta-lactamase/transpeptidase-like protein [Zopfia rhizophila CBS 207.26]|uniref:Beta-lactamase/transpeptidase-like protein n=1 Tax=Zopfia rhizophila CBS 207.26 TaxID=1314779 RepID=A0A6A6EVJ1_9PEZI|nr:beta-lactamase/transpeptidase-like protein [Zopfia rhizophila CBS 207.26]
MCQILKTPEDRERLLGRIPIYTKLQSITCQPAISVGVLHLGQNVLMHHHGRKDVDSEDAPDENTMYPIASVTKQLVAASMAALVAERKATWDTRIATILPSFSNAWDSLVGHRATIRDILSHRTGLTSLDQLVQGLDNELTVDKDEVVAFANALPARIGFRTGWQYCNLLYSLAGHIIEKLSGESWDLFLQREILDPLHMERTTASHDVYQIDDNIAKPYAILLDGTAVELPTPSLDSTHINGAAGGVRSTVSDLLRWSHALMTVAREYIDISLHKPKRCSELFHAAAIIDPTAKGEMNYGLGLVRQTTPAALGVMSPNRMFSAPVLGNNSLSHQVFSHHGNFNGASCSFYLLPESCSAIVVLSNAMGLSDATDWIAQDIIQTLFEFESIDIIKEARSCVTQFQAWYKLKIQDPLETGRLRTSTNRSVSDYVGTYCLKGYEKFTLHFRPHEKNTEKMVLIVNDRPNQRHVLSHYHFDVWEFAPASYDEYLKRGYGTYESYVEFLISFHRHIDGTIRALTWCLDGMDVVFTKCD